MTESTGQSPPHGELRWNIKDSFRDYVAELPDGAETWTGDIGGIDGHDLVFPALGIESNPESGEAILKFGGGVRYAGYRGMLRVDIADPWIELDGAGGTLTANTAPAGVPARRTVIAKVTGKPIRTGEDGWEWQAASTSLSASGASLLGSVYPPGTIAAGFRLHVEPS